MDRATGDAGTRFPGVACSGHEAGGSLDPSPGTVDMMGKADAHCEDTYTRNSVSSTESSTDANSQYEVSPREQTGHAVPPGGAGQTGDAVSSSTTESTEKPEAKAKEGTQI